jgi:hypothetical protein
MSDAPQVERLESGWFADTPVDDTLLRQYVVANAEWMEAVARASGGPVLRTDDVLIVDEHSPHLLFNTGILLRPLEPDRGDRIAADLMGFFTGEGGPFSLFCPWPTAPAELEIEAARTREELGEYEQVLVDGFPLPELQPWRPGVAFHPANLHVPGTEFFVGRVDGRPVTVATSIVGCGVNHVEFVATVPEARGHGYGEAVTWSATLAAPDLPAMLIATDMGRPVYERMGYVAVSRWTFLMGNR